MMVFRMYLLSNMAILGIHVSFRGCIFTLAKIATLEKTYLFPKAHQDIRTSEFEGVCEDDVIMLGKSKQITCP